MSRQVMRATLPMKNLTVIICLTLAVLLGGVGTSWGADSNYGDLTVIRLVSVYDGDTFVVDIDKFPEIIGKKYRFV